MIKQSSKKHNEIYSFYKIAMVFSSKKFSCYILSHPQQADLPKSVGVYMNAAEGLASEAEAALRKARKYTDAASSRLSAVVVAGRW